MHSCYVACLLLLLLCTGCSQQNEPPGPNYSAERGHDPWVIRSVLDNRPRMVSVALAEDLWVSYSTENAHLQKIWRDGINFTGAVFDTRHGPQPASIGPAYLVSDYERSWYVIDSASEMPCQIRYRGHRYVGSQVTLDFDLIYRGAVIAEIEETPEVISDDKGIGLVRTIVVGSGDHSPPLFLRIELPEGSALTTYDVSGSVVFDLESRAREGRILIPRTGGRFQWALQWKEELVENQIATSEQEGIQDELLFQDSGCATCHDATEPAVGPSIKQVAVRYADTPANRILLGDKVRQGGSGRWGEVQMPAHTDLSEKQIRNLLDYIFSFAEGTRRADLDTSRHTPLIGEDDGSGRGLAVALYRYDHQILTYMPEIAFDESPHVFGIAPAINALTGDDFGEIEEFFAGRASGFLEVPTAGTYEFRLVSEHGSQLFVNDELVVDNSGYHSLEPNDAVLDLEAGDHPIRVDFFQGDRWGGKVLVMQWRPPGESEFEVIGPENLFHRPNQILEKVAYKPPRAKRKISPGDGQPLSELHPSLVLEDVTTPEIKPMVSGLAAFDERRMVLTTWDGAGSVYLIDWEPDAGGRRNVRRIAYGLAEPLGVAVMNGQLYVIQKQELTRLVDLDGDELIDEYQAVSNGWPVSTNFHEFSFGLLPYGNGLLVSFSQAIQPGGASVKRQVSGRGSVAKIDLQSGTLDYIATGLRTPNGIGFGVDERVFITDNQGDWVPSSKVVLLEDGAWYGFPTPDTPHSWSDVTPPVVWLPHEEISLSPSQLVPLNSFPYSNQMLVGDVTHGGLKRVFLERIEGAYQGAVFRFSQGFSAGVNRLLWGPDDWLYIGGIGNPGGWGQPGKDWYGLQRVKFNRVQTFEMLAVRAMPYGFEIEFTEPAVIRSEDADALVDISQWRYVPDANYGGPKRGLRELEVTSAGLSSDGRRLSLSVNGLAAGAIVYLRLNRQEVIAVSGRSLWSTEAWYTLNRLNRGTSTTPSSPDRSGPEQIPDEM